MKLTMPVFVLSVLAGVAFVFGIRNIDTKNFSVASQQVPISIEFLSLCSGKTVSDTNNPVAVGTCHGRISGFVVGHELTVHLAGNDGDLNMWCIDHSKVTDKDLYLTVASWASTNPDRLKEFVEIEGSPNGAAALMIVAALHDAYPCIR
jgi:Rap1a immunity proteins